MRRLFNIAVLWDPVRLPVAVVAVRLQIYEAQTNLLMSKGIAKRIVEEGKEIENENETQTPPFESDQLQRMHISRQFLQAPMNLRHLHWCLRTGLSTPVSFVVL